MNEADRQRIALQEMYDRAVTQYIKDVGMFHFKDKTIVNTARANARQWKKRMLWLDKRLAELGED